MSMTFDIPIVGGPMDGDLAQLIPGDDLPETLRVPTARRMHEYRLTRLVWDEGGPEYDRFIYLHEGLNDPPTEEGWEIDREANE